jgi:hypothetical protein
LSLLTVFSLSDSFVWRAWSFSSVPALLAVEVPIVLIRFFGSVAEDATDRAVEAVGVGRVVVRVAVVDEGVVRVVEVADVSFPTGLLVEAEVEVPVRVVELAGFLSRTEPATLDLRSRVEEVFKGVRVDAVPAIDIRFAVLEMPLFSSPELATERFSSAELLTEARDRWEEVVEVLKGLRVADVVVEGRVGGLFSVLLVVPRVAEVVGLDDAVVEDEVGRLEAVELETGRLAVAAAPVPLLAGEGEAGMFSLEASGLDLTSSPPDRRVESTGVAGGATSASTSTSTSEEVGIGSSVDAIVGVNWYNCSVGSM